MRSAKDPGTRGRSRPGTRRRWGAIAIGVVVAALAAAGCSWGSSSGSSNGKVTITELDYFTSSGGNAAVNWYNKQFEAAHPNITVKREVVPYANLITKVLQEATAGDLPNIVMLDNPNVPEVAATGQLKPLNGLPGFTTSGYIPGAISECTYQGKQYCYPIGTNTIGIFYNKAMFAAKHLPRRPHGPSCSPTPRRSPPVTPTASPSTRPPMSSPPGSLSRSSGARAATSPR